MTVSREFHNPILRGCYPDPSICRVGEDYYLVTSTFEYFPGLPIFHSRDLVHWRQIGHVLNRPSQLPLQGVRASGGLYAPTIRFYEGKFYVVCTLVDGRKKSGNFLVTATDAAGPWSEPIWLEEAPGFDPSLFFDDDGRTWFVGTRLAEPAQYEGHTQIWLQELDRNTMQLKGERRIIWDGALKGGCWSEAPHIYKVGSRYYLITAEGGTGHHHAVMVARSEVITGPYESNPANPVLTHRHLGLDYPIVGTGHADLVETQSGEWWMVLLAMRPYGGYFYNLGRETFLVPLRWEDDWPVAGLGTGKVEFVYPAPHLPQHRWPAPPACDHFDSPTLAPYWNFLRTPEEEFWSLQERPGYLRLRLRPQRLSELANPSFVGRRQQHIHFVVRTVLEFVPQSPYECAGLVLIQNQDFHYCLLLTREQGLLIQLIRRAYGREEILAKRPVSGSRLYLKVEAHEQDYRFYFAEEAEAWQVMAENVDGRILSTPVAGGFTGAYIGLYASSNGQPSTNYVDFDWFEYLGLDEG